VDECARRVAVAQGRFAVPSVLKDHRVGAAADRGGVPYDLAIVTANDALAAE
jgi:hypothetical protein